MTGADRSDVEVVAGANGPSALAMPLQEENPTVAPATTCASKAHVVTFRRPNPGTHNARVLAELEATPGEWVADLYGKTRVMVHSRIDDLRGMGFVIESKPFGRGDHRYRLVQPEPVALAPPTFPPNDDGALSLFAPPPRELSA